MEKIISALNGALDFVYSNILSIAMMLLLISAGVFLSVRTGFFQFRRFGAVMKNTVGQLFDKNLHKRTRVASAPFRRLRRLLPALSERVA